MSWPYGQRSHCETSRTWQAGWGSQHGGPPNQRLVLAFCSLLVADVSKVLFPRCGKCKSRTGNKERKVCLELQSDGATGLCSYLDACGCSGCLAQAPSCPPEVSCQTTDKLWYVPATPPWLRVPRKSCEKIHRGIRKYDPRGKAATQEKLYNSRRRKPTASRYSQDCPYRATWLPDPNPPGQQEPSGVSASLCILPCELMKHLGGYMVWRPGRRDAPPCLAKPPTNPTVLSHLYTLLFLPYSQWRCYPKMLFLFVFFKSAILSMAGFCILFSKRKGHSSCALQAIKEDIHKAQILGKN